MNFSYNSRFQERAHDETLSVRTVRRPIEKLEPAVKTAFWKTLLPGGARTPAYHQVHASECGAACLGMVLAHHGCWVGMDELRRECAVSRDGCSAADLHRAAEYFGLRATGWRKEPQKLRTMRLPAILFWEFNHFVVLEGFRGDKYLLNDPANGHRTVTHAHFNPRFTGVVLELEPGANFQKRGQRPSITKSLVPWFAQHRRSLLVSLVCGLLLVVPSICLPLLLGAFIDQVLTNEQPLALAIILATCALALLNIGATWVQQRSLRNLSVAVSVAQSEQFLTKILRLPVEYFSSRFAGDLTQRAQRIDAVATAGTLQLARTLIEVCMCFLLFAAMLWIDAVITFSLLCIAVLSLLILRSVSRLRLHENHRMRREQGQLAGLSNFAARNLHSIKASGSEDEFFVTWGGFQSRELAARQSFAELGAAANSLPPLMMLLGSAVLMGLGGLRVMEGDMSVGSLMAFYFLAGNFLLPLSGFLQSMDSIHVLEADLMRINDVSQAREDCNFAPRDERRVKGVETINGRLRLAGYLEMCGVSFGYKRFSEPIVRNFELSMKPGQRVAIIGPSGSGKSTLARLLSGTYQAWEGQILFDGHKREDISHRIFSQSVAFVDQQISLFSGTIRDNLTMWNSSIPDALVLSAARDAAIHDEIARRHLNYSALVEEGGTNFSGGQRQRLEIARALVSNPSLILLDEATSALDASLEGEIIDALRRRGCACLIIAHRLSTIRDCDEIIVLDKGVIVQRGSHDELMRSGHGFYRELVAS